MGDIRNLCHDISLRVIITIIDIITISIRLTVTVLQYVVTSIKVYKKVFIEVAKIWCHEQ